LGFPKQSSKSKLASSLQ